MQADVTSSGFSAAQITSSITEGDRLGAMGNEFYTALIAIAGHDLRQPLQVIVGAHDLLIRSVRRRADQVHLSDIKNAATQLAGTFDRLVDALRLHEPSSAHHLEPVSLRALLQVLGSELAETAEQKGVELHVLASPAVVFSHPVLLEGMLRNLIRNAIHYTPSGGRVLVACRKRRSEVQIEVRDNGIGIPLGAVARIFEAFHRGDSTRSDGLGLGLFIVRRAAELLGHRGEVRSAVGRGSCFVVIADVC